MAQHYTVTTFRDFGGETASMKVYNGAITAASIAGFLSEYGTLKAATQAICEGVLSDDQWVGDKTQVSQALPVSATAQRETKMLVTYKGNTSNKLFTLTVPTFKLAGNSVPGNKDIIPLDVSPEIVAWIAAFQQIGRTPDSDTETVTVVGLRSVGRNI